MPIIIIIIILNPQLGRKRRSQPGSPGRAESAEPVFGSRPAEIQAVGAGLLIPSHTGGWAGRDWTPGGCADQLPSCALRSSETHTRTTRSLCPISLFKNSRQVQMPFGGKNDLPNIYKWSNPLIKIKVITLSHWGAEYFAFIWQ